MSNVWNAPEEVMALANFQSKRFEVKHGMFSAIPLICKGDKCPYKESCNINPEAIQVGERCPIEIGAIISRFEYWCKHFGINVTMDSIDPKDLVDATLIRDLVDNEIQTLRAENRMAQNADFIARTITTVDNKGKAYYKDEVSPEATFKLQLMDKRYKILQLLDSTRKDKSKNVKVELTPSQQALSIFNKIADKVKDEELGE